MALSAFEQQAQWHGEKDLARNPEQRNNRYEHLKSSSAVLRARFRSTPPSTRSPSSSSSEQPLIPFSNYFLPLSENTRNRNSMACSNGRNGAATCLVNQIEPNSLLESYAMQALRLDCETKVMECREELSKVKGKLKDKVRRTELFEGELEKQRRKLEGRVSFFAEHAKVLETHMLEQSTRHKEELWAQSEAFTASREQEEEEERLQTRKVISSYEDTVATLKENSEKQASEMQRLKHELSSRLEQMEMSKHSSQEQLKYLEGQLNLLTRQAESFKMSYEEQEREWAIKLQHITVLHQNQTKTLSEDYELRIEELRKGIQEEREQLISKLQTYKMQKLKDMENIEQRIMGVMAVKDSSISKLKLELNDMHRQLYESASMLDKDSAANSHFSKLELQ